MTAAHIFLRDIRSAVLMLMIAPFVLLSGIAPGTMVQADDAGVQIVLCQGDALATVILDDDHPTQTPLHQDVTCSWASVVAVAIIDASDISFATFGPGYADLPFTDSRAVPSAQKHNASARAPPLA